MLYTLMFGFTLLFSSAMGAGKRGPFGGFDKFGGSGFLTLIRADGAGISGAGQSSRQDSDERTRLIQKFRAAGISVDDDDLDDLTLLIQASRDAGMSEEEIQADLEARERLMKSRSKAEEDQMRLMIKRSKQTLREEDADRRRDNVIADTERPAEARGTATEEAEKRLMVRCSKKNYLAETVRLRHKERMDRAAALKASQPNSAAQAPKRDMDEKTQEPSDVSSPEPGSGPPALTVPPSGAQPRTRRQSKDNVMTELQRKLAARRNMKGNRTPE